jgi:hypothetical protein
LGCRRENGAACRLLARNASSDMERLVKPFGLTVSKPRLVLFREEGSQAFCLGKQNW